jgi:anhydro-N-acetylmuramic acid kinase
MTDLFIGLMSGTSVDALDIALCRFSPKLEILATAEHPFPPNLRTRINSACTDTPMLLDDLLQLDQDYSGFCAQATCHFIKTHSAADQIRAIGFHGQTLRHRPDLGATFQMANPSLLAERTGVDVIGDFRRRDMAAGGEGAPLVPAFHQYLIGETQRPVGLLNLGGIANLSLFETDGSVSGFDTGPANTLMDAWVEKSLGTSFDAGGEWAASGSVSDSLLTRFLSEGYFMRSAPKSTGRELFNYDWLSRHLSNHPDLHPADVQRTLLELTALTICNCLSSQLKRLIICGGGAHNTLLVKRISELLPSTEVQLSDELGWPSSHLEAVAFAWLAKQNIERKAGNLPEVTGAAGPRILGAHYPK